MANFILLSYHLPGGTEETDKNSVGIGVPAEILNSF
jgi:hypothetical protein